MQRSSILNYRCISRHIGILDFTLFEDHPKFMAQYQIMDVEDQFLYSDKLCIKVLDLTQLEKAQKRSNVNKKLLKWASIFKAETLEELEQLANGEEVFEKMVVTMKKLSEDEKSVCSVKQERTMKDVCCLNSMPENARVKKLASSVAEPWAKKLAKTWQR